MRYAKRFIYTTLLVVVVDCDTSWDLRKNLLLTQIYSAVQGSMSWVLHLEEDVIDLFDTRAGVNCTEIKNKRILLPAPRAPSPCDVNKNKSFIPLRLQHIDSRNHYIPIGAGFSAGEYELDLIGYYLTNEAAAPEHYGNLFRMWESARGNRALWSKGAAMRLEVEGSIILLSTYLKAHKVSQTSVPKSRRAT